jgi:hypothetical protein
MDVISKAAVEIGRRKLHEVERQFAQASQSAADNHLIQPWLNATDVARRYRNEEHNYRRQQDLRKIEDTVNQHHPGNSITPVKCGTETVSLHLT